MPERDDSSQGLRDPFQLVGATIEGKYRVDAVVGDGGFGVVYRGVHAGFDEPIAVKCLKLPLVLDEKQRAGFLEQLREEGRLLHRLSKATPGIVQALDVGALQTPAGIWAPYLILEWLEGETLADHIEKRVAGGRGACSVEEAIRLLEPAIRALAVAHAMKIAHRDVKPQNLFVTASAGVTTVKVLDFGIAKVLTAYPTFTEALAATQAAPTAFTPRYAAPEQFNKERGASGPWTDVFALGLILVELCTGKKALDGDDPTQLYINAADPARRPTPRARGASVSDAVEAVLLRALAVTPKDRWADAGELLDALLDAAGLTPAIVTGRPSHPGGIVTPRVSPRAPAEPSRDPGATVAQRGGAAASATPISTTIAAPGAGPKASVDPMSETPFFERHHLPPSTPGARPPSIQEAPPPAEPSRSRWPLVAVVLAMAGGGAGYVATGGGASFYASKPAHSAVVFTTPVLPTHKARTGPSAAPSGPVLDGSATAPSATGSAGADPGPAPLDMVLVTAGAREAGDGSPAAVSSRGFYLDRTEVTVRAYEACVQRRACAAADRVALAAAPPDQAGQDPQTSERWGPADDAGTAVAYVETWTVRCNGRREAPDHPINCVDFAGAEAFCKWSGKRLPTEAEWELAARGAEGRAYPWGADPPECGRACYDKNGACRQPGASVATCAAGLHPADRTPEGIYDMGGNVAEWVSDVYVAPAAEGGAGGPLRVVRGGSFIDGDDKLHASFRAGAPPSLAHVAIGFRCAMDAKAPPPVP